MRRAAVLLENTVQRPGCGAAVLGSPPARAQARRLRSGGKSSDAGCRARQWALGQGPSGPCPLGPGPNAALPTGARPQWLLGQGPTCLHALPRRGGGPSRDAAFTHGCTLARVYAQIYACSHTYEARTHACLPACLPACRHKGRRFAIRECAHREAVGAAVQTASRFLRSRDRERRKRLPELLELRISHHAREAGLRGGG